MATSTIQPTIKQKTVSLDGVAVTKLADSIYYTELKNVVANNEIIIGVGFTSGIWDPGITFTPRKSSLGISSTRSITFPSNREITVYYI